MPFQKNGRRQYKRELQWEKENKPERVKQRAERNAARAEVGLKVGDPRQVDHKKELIKGGSNNKNNLRITTAKTNLKKEAERKQRAAGKKGK